MTLDYAEYGSGRPLLLLLGFGMSHEDALALGYVAALRDHYRLICVSPRGIGVCPAPSETSAYAMESMVADIADLLTQLGIEKALVWGYSLGAKLALGLAAWHPHCIERILLGGFERKSDFEPETDIVLTTLRQGGEAWGDLWQSLMVVPVDMARRLQAADMHALQALRRGERDWPDMLDLLKQATCPVDLYAADNCFARTDMLKMARQTGRQCEVVSNADHFSLLHCHAAPMALLKHK
ncbi:alpha/beta hydrolase [Chromobacterium phragmitis]|uniref:alpha/beta fold hydrolase n=1 Tax=Chromobacterium amazonense TaxID=1382803 RepID=UPI0021B839D5|nr:alpha/beta hydrolase [Chromobacterium amazonense]MBM2886273.1 alpha/beta hydrolase [Chromobacterium amazonense]